MIRIPFTSPSEAQSGASNQFAHAPSKSRPLLGKDRSKNLEEKLSALEVKLVVHAEELTAQVTERVDRIRSRVERAMEPFIEGERNSVAKSNGKVIEFTAPSGDKALHHLHAKNARDAMNELNTTLAATKDHLIALDESVARMRKAVREQAS